MPMNRSRFFPLPTVGGGRFVKGSPKKNTESDLENVAGQATSKRGSPVPDLPADQRLGRRCRRQRRTRSGTFICRCLGDMFFPKIWRSSRALFVDGWKATAYGRFTQTIPVGETAFLLAAPKEQPAPETLRQTDRRRMG